MAHKYYLRLRWILPCIVLRLLWNLFHFVYFPEQFYNMKSILDSFPLSNTSQGTGGITEFVKEQEGQKTELSKDYSALFEACTRPDPNVKTLAYEETSFQSGFRNQAMAFTAFIMHAKKTNFSQVLLSTLRWQDLFGTNKHIPHELLFDVVHWNSYSPDILPRLVAYDVHLHHHLNITNYSWNTDNRTMPYAYGTTKLFFSYKDYSWRLVQDAQQNKSLHSDPAAVAIARGALRPHPNILRHIQKLRGYRMGPYIALHARVEPDMQRHSPCKSKKVFLLQDILTSLKQYFPQQPPFSQLFVAINRPLLEREGNDLKLNNTIAQENLKVLNHAAENGLWDGHVKVFEAGIASLRNTPFHNFSGITGSMVDYFLALDAEIFIGTEVSSFSVDLIAARFYRGKTANYFYTPNGIEIATDAKSAVPPPFRC